jgi:hypothetical protein
MRQVQRRTIDLLAYGLMRREGGGTSSASEGRHAADSLTEERKEERGLDVGNKGDGVRR